MKEVIFLYIVDISCVTLFESTACVSKTHFVCLVACFLLLVEKAVFEKAENLMIHTAINFRQFSFLTHLQHFCPPPPLFFFLWFCLSFKLRN